jgi:hypothetical protein
MRYFSLFFAFWMLPSLMHAQSFRENEITELTFTVVKTQDDSLRAWANEVLLSIVEEVFPLPESFTFPFSSVASWSRLAASDGKLNMFTWIYPLPEGQYRYFGFVQMAPINGECEIIWLTDNEDPSTPNHSAHEADNWPGALYYNMIVTKHKKTTYYNLIGWDGNNRMSKKKLLEPMTIVDGELQFGAEIFGDAGRFIKRRAVFEYNGEASMALNYDTRLKLIVFDHLIPMPGAQSGMYNMYGPDFTYDAYKWKKGKWQYIRDVDARNEKQFDTKKDKEVQKDLAPPAPKK